MLLYRLLIVAAAAAAYANSFRGVLVHDDLLAIRDNPHIQSLRPTWPQLWAPRDTTLAGRPVAAFTFALNYALSGTSLWSYHLLNLVIHVLVALTLLGVLTRMLAGPTARGLAAAIALIWVVHPLNTECVTYLSTRTESLMALFLLLTLYCVQRTIERGGRAWPMAAVLACALGMGTKEVAAVTPVIVLLYDRTFATKSFRAAVRTRWRLYAGLAATWLILLGLLLVNPRGQSVGFHFGDVGAYHYALTQMVVIAHYLRLCFWPHPLVLSYDLWPVVRSITHILPFVLFVGALLGTTAWALWRRKRQIGFWGAWFFLILAPSSSVVPIITELAAERRMYLPLVAVIVLVVLAATAVWSRVTARRAWSGTWTPRLTGGLVALVVMAGAVATARRNADYHSEEAVWQSVLRAWPESRTARLSYASWLFQNDRLPEGMRLLQAAAQRDPNDPDAHYGLGQGYLRLNQLPEAAAHYRRTAELDANDPRSRTNLGGVLVLLGRHAEARPFLDESLRIDPTQPHAHYHLGRVDEREGQLMAAAEHFRAAGAYEDALRVASQALEQARRAQDAPAVERVEERLRVYRQERELRGVGSR